jgi:hypothetical protein
VAWSFGRKLDALIYPQVAFSARVRGCNHRHAITEYDVVLFKFSARHRHQSTTSTITSASHCAKNKRRCDRRRLTALPARHISAVSHFGRNAFSSKRVSEDFSKSAFSPTWPYRTVPDGAAARQLSDAREVP